MARPIRRPGVLQPALAVFGFILVLGGCSDDDGSEPSVCEDWDCSGHGECMERGGDPDNRRMMVFDNLDSNQANLLNLVSTLTRIRSENVALRRGYRQTLTGGSDTFAYKMTGCGAAEDVFMLINRSDRSAPVSGLPAGNYTELIGSTQVTGGGAVEVPARSLLVLKVSQ